LFVINLFLARFDRILKRHNKMPQGFENLVEAKVTATTTTTTTKHW
jgi:hypothetical protein